MPSFSVFYSDPQVLSENPPIDVALSTLVSIAAFVVQGPEDVLLKTCDSPDVKPYLYLLPDDGAYHREGVARIQALRWASYVLHLFSFSAWNLTDLLNLTQSAQAQKANAKGSQSVSASRTHVKTPTYRTIRFTPLLRALEDFGALRQTLAQNDGGLLDAVQAMADELDEAEGKVGELTLTLGALIKETRACDLEKKSNDLDAEIQTRKTELDEVVRDCTSVSYNLKSLTEVHNTKQCQVSALDGEIGALREKLSNLQSQLVRSPEQLERKANQAKSEMKKSEANWQKKTDELTTEKQVGVVRTRVEKNIMVLLKAMEVYHQYQKALTDSEKRCDAIKDRMTEIEEQDQQDEIQHTARMEDLARLKKSLSAEKGSLLTQRAKAEAEAGGAEEMRRKLSTQLMQTQRTINHLAEERKTLLTQKEQLLQEQDLIKKHTANAEKIITAFEKRVDCCLEQSIRAILERQKKLVLSLEDS